MLPLVQMLAFTQGGAGGESIFVGGPRGETGAVCLSVDVDRSVSEAVREGK